MYPSRRKSSPCLLLLSLAAALSSTGCSVDRSPDRVVLVTIDTLRADHVGAYGYPLDITPFLDSLAESGVVFRYALAQSSSTTPSHASIFTGLYPLQHGLHSNGLQMSSRLRTLAEAFADAGYRTAAFVSTRAHFKPGGLDRGFEVFDEPVWNDPRHPRRRRLRIMEPYRPANATIDAALSWLAAVEDGEKLFLWVHLFDPHKKLQPPARFRRRVRGLVEDYGEDRHRLALESSHGDLDERNLYGKILLYDAEILFADTELARLFGSMASEDSRDLWIVTSDHGQGFLSHEDWFGHVKQIYNTQILVPLIVHDTYGWIDSRRIEDALVQHVDLVPTLGELIGFELTQPGASPQGRSLAPQLLGGRPRQAAAFGFAQSSPGIVPAKRRPDLSWPKYSLQSLDLKYILDEGRSDELYDLRSDPFERSNRLDDLELQTEQERLLSTLVRLLATLSNREIEAETVDETTLERLKALGYLQ